MKYALYSVLVFLVFAGIPAFLQEKRSDILAETVAVAWHQPELEKRAVQRQDTPRCLRSHTGAETSF
jgi:hypothetical protein